MKLRSRKRGIIALALMLTMALASNIAVPMQAPTSTTSENDIGLNAFPERLILGDSTEDGITVYFFWAIGCPHCAKAEPTIDYLEEKYPQVTFLRYEVTRNTTNSQLYWDFNHRFNVQNPVVPSVFVGDEALIGEDPIINNLESILIRMIEASLGPPSAPRNLRATPGDSFIYLVWQAPSDDGGTPITNYEVWRGSTTGKETFLADVGTKLWYNNTGLNNGQTYYYVVKAENAKGLSPSSNEVSVQPSPTALVPSKPQDLVATVEGSNVILTWHSPSNDGGAAITNYTVYRGMTSGEEIPAALLGNVHTYTDYGLTNGQTYYYKVSASNSMGEGPTSNVASAVPGIPSAPVGLTATAGDSQVKLEWGAPIYSGPGTIVYHLFRNGTEVWNGVVNEYVDPRLINGVTYNYSLAASNTFGWGPNTSNVLATPTLPGGNNPPMELTIGAVVVAALVDSINPCAISVMIFLLIFLTSLGNKRRVLIVGLVYIATVYAVYFLAGIGLLTFLQSTAMTRYVYYGAAIISVVFGLINIKDFFFKRDEPTLAISESKKPLIKKYIEKASIPAAVALGAMVSLFELPCTGGIYLAILSLLGNTMTFSEGAPWLALYNFIFVLPLIIVLGVIFMGVSAEKANEWRLQKRSYLRLLIGVVMLVLGAMMLLGVF
jgi:cytochrome c biogenesis protein CcdA/thiol-disulfide isomerase/thioredoxin